MRKALLIIVAAAALSACDEAQKGFSEGFDKNFNEQFSASCLASATKGGAPAHLAKQACDCALAKVNETMSTTEKMGAGSDKLMPIMEECVKTVVQKNG